MSFLLLTFAVFYSLLHISVHGDDALILATKRIYFERFPDAFNPSIIPFEKGYLLSFRYNPNRWNYPYLSYIGLVLLDNTLNPISEPQLIKTRPTTSAIIPQAEDARFFSYKGRIFLIYNDNAEKACPTTQERRDMFIAELFYTDGCFTISSPRKLIYEAKYNIRLWQKNWLAFQYKDALLLTYMINPHEILTPNLMNGSCYFLHETQADIDWNWGEMRGSSCPLLDDGEYLAFFHSGKYMVSECSWGYEMWHLFMGAYTFSADPPFQITKISSEPIITQGFYTPSIYNKRVIYPGGYVIAGPHIYLAYGKDDREIWIATLDKDKLKASLRPVNQK